MKIISLETRQGVLSGLPCSTSVLKRCCQVVLCVPAWAGELGFDSTERAVRQLEGLGVPHPSRIECLPGFCSRTQGARISAPPCSLGELLHTMGGGRGKKAGHL